MHDSLAFTAFANTAEATMSPRDLYLDQSVGPLGHAQRARARRFLESQLVTVSDIESTLPTAASGLFEWMSASTDEVGQAYSEYLHSVKPPSRKASAS